MLVEHWGEFINLLNELYPGLKPGDKVKCLTFRKWATLNQQRYDGIALFNINLAISWLETIRLYLPTNLYEYLTDAITFIGYLNTNPPANTFETELGCKFWGNYWYDEGCYAKPKPEPVAPIIPDEPIEPVEPVEPYIPPERECIDSKNEFDCLASGCYWWGGGCHDRPEPTIEETGSPFKEFAKQIDEYCQAIPFTETVKKTTCITFKNILLFIDEFITWQQSKK